MRAAVRSYGSLLLALSVCFFISGCSPSDMATDRDGRMLIIGASEEPQTLDPHYGLFGQIQQAVLPLVFEPLFFRDVDAKTILPRLATSYTAHDAQTFEIMLRKGVTFSDGTPFDGEDVVFSFKRLANPPGASIPIKYIADVIDHIEILDPHRVMFHLSTPTPGFIGYLIEAPILSSGIGGAGPADFNALTAAIGTGPYRIESWSRGDNIAYRPNDRYWGAQAEWDEITLKFLPNHAARIAALLSGDIDVTNYIPTADIERLNRDPDVGVVARHSNRPIYFHLDVERPVTPFITDKSGAPIPNPLRDKRVREALSIALDRDLIVEKLLGGYATPAFQWMAAGHLGHNADLSEYPYDRDRARALLTDAGYADGFSLTLHGTAGLYGPDVRLLQAMASMWAKIGLDVTVEALPPSIYWDPWYRREFSVALSSYGFHPHRIIPVLNGTITSSGHQNIGGYKNEIVDRLLSAAQAAPLEAQQALMAEVSAHVHSDIGLLVLYHIQYVFAYRTNHLTYDPTENLRDLEPLRAFPVSATASSTGDAG